LSSRKSYAPPVLGPDARRIESFPTPVLFCCHG
jgi:hypothetical protein